MRSPDNNTDAVSVERVTDKDRDEVCSLRLLPSQEEFVASNDDSLAEATENPACVPLAIRARDHIVGFAMFALDRDDGNYWLYRFMIDARFQGQGYGSEALRQIVASLATRPDCTCVMLGVKSENEYARGFYRRAGFRETGMVIDGDIVMSRPF